MESTEIGQKANQFLTLINSLIITPTKNGHLALEEFQFLVILMTGIVNNINVNEYFLSILLVLDLIRMNLATGNVLSKNPSNNFQK